MPGAGGTTRRMWSPTSSTGTSTTPTSASPTAGSARSTAGPRTSEGYVLSFEQIGAKIDECKAIGGVQILLQGGHNPYIPFEWYLELMRYIKRNHPIHIHGFSPVAKSSSSASGSAFRSPRLSGSCRAAGLDSIPGGGGEILVDAIRERVAKKKAQTEEWLGVQEEAHRQGMKTSVTMMYGLGESNADRIEHLLPRPRAAGPHGRIHRVHLLAAPARGYTRDVALPEDRRGDLPPHAGARPHRARQRAQPAVLLGDDGPQGGPGRAPLRRQRLRQPHDGGERGVRRRHHVSHHACRDRPAHPGRGLRAAAAPPGLLDPRRQPAAA